MMENDKENVKNHINQRKKMWENEYKMAELDCGK